ncbi:MAG: hypothetical protein AMXMBFR55_23050 [Gemmatimonadota bacterium]
MIVLRSIFLTFLTLGPCVGCAAMATQVNVSRSSPLLGSYHPASVQSVFTSRLSASPSPSSSSSPASPASVAPAVRESEAWGTVRLMVKDDDALEYLATIYNPRGETFSTAYLRRGGASADGVIVATLFSDVALRTPYIQVRGTISLARNERAGALAEELRENPHAFGVSVHASPSAKGGTIRGGVE